MHTEAARFPGQEAAVLEYFQKNDSAKNELQAPIFEDKVVDFIVELAKVTEKEVSMEDLMKLDQSDDNEKKTD
jgi:trigger factor